MIGNEEKESVVGLFPFFKSNPVLFDVGSNKGGWADIVLEEFGEECTLHLFEPNEKLLSFTEIKYEYKKNINYHLLAAYKESGKQIPFYYFTNYNNELSSLYKGDKEWEGLPMQERLVDTITLDNFCQQRNTGYVDCIKIDAEGADPDVVQGCLKLMANDAVGFVTVEYGEHYKRASHTFREVLDIAEQTGYKVYYYGIGNYFEVKPSDFVEDYKYQNFILTKFNIRNYSIGWNKEFIINTAELPKMDLVLEVGSFEGITTKYICENLLNEEGRIVCVDPLEDYYTKEDTEHKEMFIGQYERFLRNTKGLPVNLHRKISQDALPELHELRFNLIYIDGDHSKDAVLHDGCWAFKICKVGGWILFDDYEWRETTKEGVDEFLRRHLNRVEVVSRGYQVLVQKKSD